MTVLARITWDERYSVGCRYIDRQHRKLVEIVNDFFHAVQEKHNRESLSSILNRLVKYAEEHFQDEERIVEHAGFPSALLEMHREEHESLTIEIFQIAQLYESDRKIEKSFEETASLLKRWLLGHILDSDMQYAPYVSELSDSDIYTIIKH